MAKRSGVLRWPFSSRYLVKTFLTTAWSFLFTTFFAHNLSCKGISLFTANLVYAVNFFQPLNDGIEDVVVLDDHRDTPAEHPV